MRPISPHKGNAGPPYEGLNAQNFTAAVSASNPMPPCTASPLKLIGITQSVQIVAGSDGVCTRHDILDHLWVLLLEACGCLALPIPNHPILRQDF